VKRSAPLQRHTALTVRTPLSPGDKPLARRKPLQAVAGPARTTKPQSAPRDTGFPAEVKLLIRTRAGNGDPEQARCEACNVWLGLHGGQIQHIYARGKGGTSDPLYNSAANGAALCGTSETGDHGLCEDRDPHMNEMGFWRKRNGKERPGDYPIMLHGQGGGRLAWLTPEGDYADAPPREAVA
jgi:hypothetical protein